MSKSRPGNSIPRKLRIIPKSEQNDYKVLGNTGAYVYKERFNIHRVPPNILEPSSNTDDYVPVSPATSSPERNTAEFQVNLRPSPLDRTVRHLNISSMDDDDDQKSPMAAKTDYEEIEEEHEQLVLLEDDLSDFLDENRIDVTTMNAEDLDTYVSRMEEYRKLYKMIDKNIRKKISDELYKQKYSNLFGSSLKLIKQCIMQAKEKKSSMRQRDAEEETIKRNLESGERMTSLMQKKEAADFLMWEASRMMTELNNEFGKVDDVDDDELLQRKADHAEIAHQLDRLSNKIQQVYQIKTETIDVGRINDMRVRYDALLAQKERYDTHLRTRMKERELLKEKAFQKSSLNIQLPKFKGYESEMDIYTFQTEFEKLYLRLTPKKRLPDVIKYSHLEDPALALVKSQDDIDEIWTRLKKAYGDKKVLLQKNLSDVTKSAAFLKSKDPEQLKQGLMKLINTMNDLIKLAEKHNIENKLYNGDGINTIYSLLGENRLTRWLTSISDVDVEEKDLWTRLIRFLEKELKVVQEKALLNVVTAKVNHPRDRDRDTKQNRNDKSQSYHSNGDSSSIPPKCPFCNEHGHAATNGPRGIKLIQYFSCEKFVNMPINQKFQELRSKNFCHQCLYPGAKQDEGRHKDGTCQKTFICKHASHETYPRKKHVLVCAEHCETEENKKLFEEYKTRFILRNKCPLPEFSKEMKLSFYVYKAQEDKDS